MHGYHMMRDRGRVLENAEIAANWYDAIYTPTLAAIDRLRLDRLYRDLPPGDLFLVLHGWALVWHLASSSLRGELDRSDTSQTSPLPRQSPES